MTSRDPTLRFRPIAAAVVHTFRRHAWRILVVSIVVSAVTVAAELAADHLLDQADVTSALVGALSTSTVSLLGAVFLSGFLCRLVSATEHGPAEHGKTGPGETGPGETGPGHGETGHGTTEHGTTEHGTTEHGTTEHGKTGPGETAPGHGETGHGGTEQEGKSEHGKTGQAADGSRIRDVLRSLPWGSLILADLLATLIIVVGLVALIIPGLIAITLLAVVGPVIELEHRRAVAGLRRSAHLVRPSFWRVAAFATLPLLVANGVVGILPDPSGTTDVVTTLIVRSVGEGVVESVVGLLLVELCYRLIAADRAAARRAAPPVVTRSR
jgi:hypothetical protein